MQAQTPEQFQSHFSLKSAYKNSDFGEWKLQNICHILVGKSTK